MMFNFVGLYQVILSPRHRSPRKENNFLISSLKWTSRPEYVKFLPRLLPNNLLNVFHAKRVNANVSSAPTIVSQRVCDTPLLCHIVPDGEGPLRYTKRGVPL